MSGSVVQNDTVPSTEPVTIKSHQLDGITVMQLISADNVADCLMMAESASTEPCVTEHIAPNVIAIGTFEVGRPLTKALSGASVATSEAGA